MKKGLTVLLICVLTTLTMVASCQPSASTGSGGKKSIVVTYSILGAVVKEGTAVRAKELKRPVYGKTGTTNDYTDAWFIGFDDNLVVGVWVGRDDHTPIGNKETGAMAALPIWIDFMKHAGENPL